MMQYVRYLPIILELFKKGKDAKEVLQNIGKSDKKLSDLKYLAEFGSDASKTIQDLFTDTEEDRQKYPKSMFTGDLGYYLRGIEERSKKDYKNAIKTLVGVGLAGYMLSPLGKKYPVPEVILADKKEPPQPEQTTIDIVPPQLPPPPEQMRAKEGEVITPPVTPKQRGQIKRFEAAQRLKPEMAQGPTLSQEERQPSAISPQPSAPQPSAPQPSALEPQTVSQPILFETKTYKEMPGPGNTIRRLVEQGFDEETINKFFKKYQSQYAKRFELETGKKIKDEIRDIIASVGGIKASPKPKQLYTSKEDKKIQDAGLKPKLKPMRKKQEMGDFMKQVQESARPTESLTAPTDRQAFMNSMLELQNLLRGS